MQDGYERVDHKIKEAIQMAVVEMSYREQLNCEFQIPAYKAIINLLVAVQLAGEQLFKE